MYIGRFYSQNIPARMIYISYLLVVFTPCVTSKLFIVDFEGRHILLEIEFSARVLAKSGNRIVTETSISTDDVWDWASMRSGHGFMVNLYYNQRESRDLIEFRFEPQFPAVDLKTMFLVYSDITPSGQHCFSGPLTRSVPTPQYSYECSRHERLFYHEVPCYGASISPYGPTFLVEVDMKYIRAQAFGNTDLKFSRSIECKGYSNQASVIVCSLVFAIVLIAIVVVVVVLVLRRRKQTQNNIQEPNERSSLGGGN